VSPARPPRGLRDLEDLNDVFEALAHHTRRTILVVLHARGDEMTSGAIASRFECAWPTVTRHLRVLEDAGLVSVGLRGRERIYSLNRDRLLAVAGAWLERFAHNMVQNARPARRSRTRTR